MKLRSYRRVIPTFNRMMMLVFILSIGGLPIYAETGNEIKPEGSPVKITSEIAGYSVKGQPLELIKIGKDTGKTILYMGVFHGNEPLGKYLIYRLIEYLKSNPGPAEGKNILLLPVVNPDGYALKKRTNARGVDINRNFPTQDWRRNYSMDRFKPGKRKREPETIAIMEILNRYKPDIILSVHSPHRCINYDGPAKNLADFMAKFNHYPVRSTMGYLTPGSFGTYAGKERGISCITLELSKQNPEDSWNQNKDALLAPLLYSDQINTNSVFIDSCIKGDNDKIADFLKNGYKLDEKDDFGWNGLMYAVYYNKTETVKLLLNNGTDAGTSEKRGWTPLIIASQKGNKNIVNLLIDKGVSIDIKDAFGSTALLEAGRYGHGKIVKILLEQGADISIKDNEGKTSLLDAARNGYLLTIKALVEGGADINERDGYGRTPLMEAAYYGYVNTLKYLLENGADPSARDNKGHTALNDAVSEQNTKAAKVLRKFIKNKK